MARPIKWKKGTFQEIKIKVLVKNLTPYRTILRAKGKTIQNDIVEHIQKAIK